ncbi:MBL fold metallo-hydrolase [Pseudonocardia xinjiangensis]|uniref:MBL fold metallo-hydrolase n=1 Tax=Pseudonocardia xinjiangensis TaxID=75289 RepID=UPI003D93409F
MEGPAPGKFLFADAGTDRLIALADGPAPWLRPHFVDNRGMLLSKIQALVIDTGSRRIIVDTCLGNGKERAVPNWSGLQLPFLEDLAAAGYPTESIDTVVCTHLHVDHVGWNTRLEDGAWVPTFPNARYLFVRGEYQYWNEAGYADEPILEDSITPVMEAGLVDLVAADHVLLDEGGTVVRFEPTFGHTPAHVSVVIESVGRRAVISGDLIHHPVQMAIPNWASRFDYDADATRATRKAFLDRYADGSTLVIGTHFATPSAGKIVALDAGTWKLEV